MSRSTSNLGSTTLDRAIAAARETEARSTEPNPDLVPGINVNGRMIVVDDKGHPATQRDRDWLEAVAAHTAQRNLDATIRNANKNRDITNKLPARTVTDTECASTYRQILADGAHRAETGQSAGPDADHFKGLVDNAHGTDEQAILDTQRREQEQARQIAVRAAEQVTNRRAGPGDDLVYDHRVNAYRSRDIAYRDRTSPTER